MEALRHIRTMRGMNQVDLAKASGVAQNTISEIELGKREARPGTLKKLAHALGVEIADFFEDTHPSGQSPQPPLEIPELPGLKPTRERVGISISELAFRSGIPLEEISDLEAGDLAPAPGVSERLADALGVWRAELFFPPEQVQVAKAEDAQSSQVMKELSELSPATVRALRTDVERRVHERLVEAYRKNDEQRAREEPKAG